jgi:transcriptional regulator of acetoin/glycerol metabolism
VERAVILSDGDTLTAADFDLASRAGAEAGSSLNLQANERRLVETALERFEGNVSRAAEALGITRAALYRRMEKFGL